MHDIRLLAAALSFVPSMLMSQSASVTIHAGRLLDGRGGVMDNATIVVDRTSISRVERGTAGSTPTYDLGRYTVLPGLIDGHAHVSWYFNRSDRYHTPNDGDTPVQSMLAMVANAFATLTSGVTTIQSPGSPEDKDLRDFIETGPTPGPRVLTSLQPISSAASRARFDARGGAPPEGRGRGLHQDLRVGRASVMAAPPR